MAATGWNRLLEGAPWFRGEGAYPITAYSEFIPPPRLGQKPYSEPDPFMAALTDHYGWHVTEYEEAFELLPGLDGLARELLAAFICLGEGRSTHGLSRHKLTNNPYWPPELAERAGKLNHEHYVMLAPLALSRTQDDKGRLRWTFFGGSEQGPARAFWRSFFRSPKEELPEEQALDFFRQLLSAVYNVPNEDLADLRKAGLRILPMENDLPCAYWREDPWPSWADRLFWGKGQSLHGVKYLLTFRAFGNLPAAARKAYLAGELHLLPFPGTLVPWGVAGYDKLLNKLPFAHQLPFLQLAERHENPRGLRVPQSGWMQEVPPHGAPSPLTGYTGPHREKYKRTHRWARIHRHEDELQVIATEDRIAHVLFCADAGFMGLYGKPMARNAQIWNTDFRVLLNGPNASRAELATAAKALRDGGLFGYRFHFPAMRVGMHEVYWHRPLVAFRTPSGHPTYFMGAPLGYLTAYRVAKPDLARPVELWPRLLHRSPHLHALHLFDHAHDFHHHRTTLNIRKLLDLRWQFPEGRVPRPLARSVLTVPKHETIDDWIADLPKRACDAGRGWQLAEELRESLLPEPAAPVKRSQMPKVLTLGQTARRSFEVAYWKTIAFLAEGRFVNKENADCVRDQPTHAALPHHHRDLDLLGDYLIDYYRKVVAKHRMTGKALVGDLPFCWRTDFDYSWMGGWLSNQDGEPRERNIITVIPGRDRKRAVIMGDHYDTAYMADHFEKEQGGSGARLAAAGADDNHSATVALMLAAPIFLKLSREGKLACDIWLIHLTGEEFPADCMGARHLCQRLVEGSLKMRSADGKFKDLSKTRAQGVYVLDMVAHNNDHDRDVFQISPGVGRESMWLAYQAHLANEAWNAWRTMWNGKAERHGKAHCRRSADPRKIPEVAPHPHLHGEVRVPYDPRSTLFNTDGQIFSDAGVPVVLFMENYDINRRGYHDSADTMENIDLDYGAGVAAIAIEAVARAATEEPIV
jgi:hypothetical protein